MSNVQRGLRGSKVETLARGGMLLGKPIVRKILLRGRKINCTNNASPAQDNGFSSMSNNQ